MSLRKLLQYGVSAAFLVGVAIQFVPYGKEQVNPPVVREPLWDKPQTRALVKRACFNCHSHETIWPWYAKIAPASWLVHWDVKEARGKLNFSDWQDGLQPGESPGRIKNEVTSGKMPPFQYRIAHPEARLSEAEVQQLVEGLTLTINGK